MSDRDNFAGGFLAGAILGGVLGGILGATLTQRQSNGARLTDGKEPGNSQTTRQDSHAEDSSRFKRARPRRWVRRAPEPSIEQPIASEARIEEARRNLEHKITALNIAIDDARQQLGEAGTASVVSSGLDDGMASHNGTVNDSETDSPAA